MHDHQGVRNQSADKKWKKRFKGMVCATPPYVQVHHCMWFSFIRP